MISLGCWLVLVSLLKLFATGEWMDDKGIHMTVLILDDHNTRVQNLAKSLSYSINNCNIMLCNNHSEAMNIAKYYNIDLFIIDVDELSRMNFAKQIRQLRNYYITWMILLAKKNIYNSIDVYRETHCYHYINTPYSMHELMDKIKYLTQFEIKYRNTDNHLFLCKKYKDMLYKIDINTIIYIEINLKDIIIKTNIENYNLKNLTLRKFAASLPANMFIQCHKSYIVNIKNVKNVEYLDHKAYLNLKFDMGKIPIGSKYIQCLKDKIQFLIS